MAYDVLHELKTEADVKSAGKYRQEGKNYVVQVSCLMWSPASQDSLRHPQPAPSESFGDQALTPVVGNACCCSCLQHQRQNLLQMKLSFFTLIQQLLMQVCCSTLASLLAKLISMHDAGW